MHRAALASSALYLVAMPAMAEVTLSGRAEIGFGRDMASGSVRFHHDLDVSFTLTGETDGGLVFGATIDLDEVSSGIGPDDGLTSGNPGSVFISGDFGTIDLGDVDGAFDWALREVSWGTTIADDHSLHAGFNANIGLDQADLNGESAQIMRYEYATGDFAFALSADLGTHDTFGFGIKYGVDIGATTLIFGVAAQSGDYAFNLPSVLEPADTEIRLAGKGEIYGASVQANFGSGISVIVNHSRLEANFDRGRRETGTSPTIITNLSGLSIPLKWSHTGLGVAYQQGDLLLEANYGEFDTRLANADLTANGFGLAMNYNLGGGATVALGYGYGRAFHVDSLPVPDEVKSETFSAGLVLNF